MNCKNKDLSLFLINIFVNQFQSSLLSGGGVESWQQKENRKAGHIWKGDGGGGKKKKEARKWRENKGGRRTTRKKLCVCFSRLEVTDLEGLPQSNSQPRAMRVCVCICVKPYVYLIMAWTSIDLQVSSLWYAHTGLNTLTAAVFLNTNTENP